jgi:hypothetical protein
VRNKPTKMDESSSASDSGDEFEPEAEQAEAEDSSSDSPAPAPKPTKKKSDDKPRESVKAPPKPADDKKKAAKVQNKARAKKKSANRSPARKGHLSTPQDDLAAEYNAEAVDLALKDDEGTNTRVLALGIAAKVIKAKSKEAKALRKAKNAGEDASTVDRYTEDTIALPADFMASHGLLMPETNVENLINQVNKLLYVERPKEQTKKTGEKVTIQAKIANYHIELSEFDEESMTFTVA